MSAQIRPQANRALLQRQHLQTASGRYVGDLPGGANNLREEVLQVMDRLHALWSMPNADYAAEYPAVSALPAASTVPIATIPKTLAALKRNEDATMNQPVAQQFLDLTLSAEVGRGQPNNKSDIYGLQDVLHRTWMLSNADYATERTAVNSSAGATVPDAQIPKTIAGLAAAKAAIVGGTFRRDLFAGVHTVTPAEHAAVEGVLRPGATVTPAVGGAPPVVHNPPAMTGAGVGAAFETAMLDSLKRNVGSWASTFRTLKTKSGQPSFPVSSANSIAVSVQQETERYFAPFIRVASRAPAGTYHPGGSYSLVSQLGDQSTRPIDDTYSPGGRRGWTEGYWMTLSGCPVAPCPQAVLNTYNCLPTRRPPSPDSTEFTRVGTKFATDPANRADIDDAIHSWPAEAATGTVFIQPYKAAPPADIRKIRWDLFTTLIHEMMHVLAHPNFEKTADAVGGPAQKYLSEGFADVMRHELWDGPGALQTRLSSAEMAPLRQQVEGNSYPYDPAVVVYHPDYGEYAQAKSIDAAIGHANAKAAFFLGHTELLGLGQGTQSQAPLTGLASYRATDSAQAEWFVARAGDTYAMIQTRTNAPAGGILNSAGLALTPGSAITAGMRLRVPGIQWAYAIKDDTLGTIATQHSVSVANLAVANALPAGTPESHPMPVGTRVLIPIHTVLP
jgi:hypothetical protein